MAAVRKILGQKYPSAGALSTLYTVPDDTQAVLSTVTVCNQSKEGGTFRVAVAKAGAVDESKQYLYYDEPIDGRRAFAFTLGVTLGETDELRCYSSNGSMSFNAFGAEEAA